MGGGFFFEDTDDVAAAGRFRLGVDAASLDSLEVESSSSSESVRGATGRACKAVCSNDRASPIRATFKDRPPLKFSKSRRPMGVISPMERNI